METSEINELAKTHAEAILANKLTMAEIVMLVACIQARIERVLFGETETAPTHAPVKADVVAKTVSLGKVIADKGYPCVCITCAKHIYTTNKEIHENEPVDSFIAGYTPMPGYPVLTKKIQISNIDGNISTNCPDCGGELSLYLSGRQIG